MDTTNGFLEAGKHSRTSSTQWNQTFYEIIFVYQATSHIVRRSTKCIFTSEKILIFPCKEKLYRENPVFITGRDGFAV